MTLHNPAKHLVQLDAKYQEDQSSEKKIENNWTQKNYYGPDTDLHKTEYN